MPMRKKNNSHPPATTEGLNNRFYVSITPVDDSRQAAATAAYKPVGVGLHFRTATANKA